MSNKANQESICTNGTLNILQSPQGAENRAGTQTLVDTSAEQKGRDLYIQAESCHDRAAPPAEQPAITSESGAVYAELPAPTASIGIDDAWHEPAMRDFADRTHALRMEQAAPKAAPGDNRKAFESWARRQPWIKDCGKASGGDAYGHWDTQKAWVILTGMLGIAGARTFEKVKGVSK